MIISKITGGLGNQLFQYAIAKNIALKSNEVFKLDINSFDDYKLHNGYRLNCFNIEEKIATKKEISKLKGNTFIRKICNKLKINSYKNKTYYKEEYNPKYDEKILNYKNIYLNGYFQCYKYFSGIEDILKKEFSIKNNINLNINKYIEEIKSTNSVSIHIRRGDYLKLSNIYVNLDEFFYKKAISIILKEVHKPKFFIFSNDINWCENNFKFLENKVFIKNTKTELDDLYLMKNCKHNIIANSSFSFWGAFLNENKNKIIISPKKHFTYKIDESIRYPDNWILI